MLGFIHPCPPSRKEVAMQVARQERTTFSATELVIDLPDDPVVGAPPDDAPLRFGVAYSLRDYLGVAREHIAFLARCASPARRRAGWLGPIGLAAGAGALAWVAGPGWMRTVSLAAGALSLSCLPFMVWPWLGLLGAPILYAGKRRMPACEFRIDAHGIERTSTRGTSTRRWADVRAVRRYRNAYLLVFDKGAMPIPLRCMSAAQRQRLRALALLHE